MLTMSQKAVRTARSTGSLSRRVSAWAVVHATVIKELQIARRYIPDLIGNIVQLAVRVAFFLLLSNLVAFKGANSVPGQDLTGRSLFIFFQGALLLFVFNGTALWTPINSVTRDLTNGTLEYLYSGPSSRYAYFVGTVVANAIISQVLFLPLYLFLCFYARSNTANMLMVLLVCLVVLVTLMALGIMIALLALLWRQVGSIAEVLGLLFEFLAGAYIPVTAFPTAVQYLAYLLPYTWGYDLVRYYSFGGRWATLLPVWGEWLVLGAYAVLYTLLSRYLLRKAEQQAKQQGLHLI